MKTKKSKPRKTKKGYVKKNKTRGGAQYEGNHENWNGTENWNGEWNGNENRHDVNPNFVQAFQGPFNPGVNVNNRYEPWLVGNNRPENGWQGQANENREVNPNYVQAFQGRANGNNGNGNANNYNYDGGDEDTDEDEDDEEQDYENYQDYVEDLTEGLDTGCTTSSLEEKLYAVDREIEKVSDAYETLVKGIALQTLADYVDSGSLRPSYSAELSEWHRNASRRASQYQRINEEDLNNAFLYLLPSFNVEDKYMVLNENDEDTSMHVMIKYYAYKMITALFTRSNITYAVIKYSEVESHHRFLNNLLGVMRCASRITHQYVTESWNTFLEIPMDRTRYVHSGGNMVVMIAGMLCYLYDTWNSGYYQYNTYENTLLDEIRQEFEAYLVATYGSVDGFYGYLTGRMREEEYFQENIQRNTEKISDVDLIFMGPNYVVNRIDNPYLFQISELTAYVLRRIMVTAHSEEETHESWMAYTVMPFAGEFDDSWKRFKFSNMSGVTPETVEGMRQLHERDYYGYRQSSNYIEGVPMYLNRIKQGYQPFFDLDLSKIPVELQQEYSNKYGECLDCSIGAKTNDLYNHKQINYMTNNHAGNINGEYYSLNTIIYELNIILQGRRDDKYEKRENRRDFLVSIDVPDINVLFNIMGKHIT